MIINNPALRTGFVVEALSNTANRQTDQRNAPTPTSAQPQNPATLLPSANSINRSERIDLRVLRESDLSFQQQRALSTYLATEFSSEESERPSLNITA